VILPEHEHFKRLHAYFLRSRLGLVQLFWTYTPSPVDRSAAEMWISTHDCSVVDMIAIGEHSLATSANRREGTRPPAVTIKRHFDLGADLATAIVGLRLRLPPNV
jgi:hypothetical protein